MTLLIVATRNRHKVQEIRGVLADAFVYRTLDDLTDPPVVVEDADSFTGNAVKKAVALARWLAARPHIQAQLLSSADEGYCLADDSGLEVDALQGAPGVHSARFAALDTSASGNSSDQANNAKLLRLLKGVPPAQRTARFRCVIALTPLLWPSPANASPVCSANEAELQTQTFDGACEGRIDTASRGTHGFGYDPLFIPENLTQSFAELGEDLKNSISHRARALHKLKQWFNHKST